MNYESLRVKWKDDIEKYEKFIEDKDEFNEILDKIFTNRVKIFQDLKVEDVELQKNIVELINNVVWERQIQLKKTKIDLELCFTPDVRTQLKEEGKWDMSDE